MQYAGGVTEAINDLSFLLFCGSPSGLNLPFCPTGYRSGALTSPTRCPSPLPGEMWVLGLRETVGWLGAAEDRSVAQPGTPHSGSARPPLAQHTKAHTVPGWQPVPAQGLVFPFLPRLEWGCRGWLPPSPPPLVFFVPIFSLSLNLESSNRWVIISHSSLLLIHPQLTGMYQSSAVLSVPPHPSLSLSRLFVLQKRTGL